MEINKRREREREKLEEPEGKLSSSLNELPSGYEFHKLGPRDADECYEHREKILEELRSENRSCEYLVDESEKNFKNFFYDKTCDVLGIVFEKRIVAFAISSFRAEMLERFRGILPESVFTNKYDLCYIEMAEVSKEHRGKRLEAFLVAQLQENAFQKWKTKNFAVIYYPGNIASKKSLERCGFYEFARFVHKDTGYDRVKAACLDYQGNRSASEENGLRLYSKNVANI